MADLHPVQAGRRREGVSVIRNGYLFADVPPPEKLPWKFGAPLEGTTVIASHLMCEWDLVQWRFPRSKKRRIRKKWAKDKRNWRSVMVPTAVLLGGVMFAHPSIVEKLRP